MTEFVHLSSQQQQRAPVELGGWTEPSDAVLGFISTNRRSITQADAVIHPPPRRSEESDSGSERGENSEDESTGDDGADANIDGPISEPFDLFNDEQDDDDEVPISRGRSNCVQEVLVFDGHIGERCPNRGNSRRSLSKEQADEDMETPSESSNDDTEAQRLLFSPWVGGLSVGSPNKSSTFPLSFTQPISKNSVPYFPEGEETAHPPRQDRRELPELLMYSSSKRRPPPLTMIAGQPAIPPRTRGPPASSVQTQRFLNEEPLPPIASSDGTTQSLTTKLINGSTMSRSPSPEETNRMISQWIENGSVSSAAQSRSSSPPLQQRATRPLLGSFEISDQRDQHPAHVCPAPASPTLPLIRPPGFDISLMPSKGTLGELNSPCNCPHDEIGNQRMASGEHDPPGAVPNLRPFHNPDRGKSDVSSRERFQETLKELLTDLYRISNLEPAAMLEKKIPKFRRKVANRGTVNMLSCSTPVLASMSLRWMQAALLTIFVIFVYFGSYSLAHMHSTVFQEYSQFKFTMLDHFDGKTHDPPLMPVNGFGFLRGGCLVNETLRSDQVYFTEQGSLILAYDKPIQFDGFLFHSYDSSDSVMRFQLHGRSSDQDEWTQCGSSTYSWLTHTAQLVFLDGPVSMHNPRHTEIIFDMRVGWQWQLTNVGCNLVFGLLILCVAMLAIFKREARAQELLVLTMYVASILHLAVAVGYNVSGQNAQSFMPWVLAIIHAFIPSLLLVRQDVFIEALVLLGASVLSGKAVNESVVLPDDHYEVSWASIVVLIVGLSIALWRHVLLQATRKLVIADKEAYDTAWKRIVEDLSSKEELLYLRELVVLMQGRQELKRQHCRRRHDTTSTSSTSPGKNRDPTPHRYSTTNLSAVSQGDASIKRSSGLSTISSGRPYSVSASPPAVASPLSPALQPLSPPNLGTFVGTTSMLLSPAKTPKRFTWGVSSRRSSAVHMRRLSALSAGRLSMLSQDGEQSVVLSVAHSIQSVQIKQEQMNKRSRGFMTEPVKETHVIRRLSGYLALEQRKVTVPGVVDLAFPITSIDQLFHQAAVMQIFLRTRCQEWALQSNGMFPLRFEPCELELHGDDATPKFMRWHAGADPSRVQWGRLKSVTRAFEKLLGSYGENTSKLCDLSREQIVFSDVSDLRKCFEMIVYDQDVVVAYVRNGMDPTVHDSWHSAGYRCVSLYIRVVGAGAASYGIDTHVAEINLVLLQIAGLTTAARHKRYKKFRDFRDQAVRQRFQILWEVTQSLVRKLLSCLALLCSSSSDEPETYVDVAAAATSPDHAPISRQKRFLQDSDGLQNKSAGGGASAGAAAAPTEFEDLEPWETEGASASLQEIAFLQFQFLKNSILPAGVLERKMVNLSDAMRYVHSNSVIFTTSPLSAALSKRRWRTLVVALAFVFTGICTSSAYTYTEMQRGRRYFKFVALELRNGVVDPLVIGTPSVDAIGLRYSPCELDVIMDSGARGPYGSVVETGPGYIAVSLPQERHMDGWYLRTHRSNPAELDPVRFHLEYSQDEGATWHVAGSSTWTYTSSIASVFMPLDGYFNVSMQRGSEHVFPHFHEARNLISAVASGVIGLVLFAAVMCGVVRALKFVYLFFPLLLLASAVLDGGAAISLFLEGFDKTLIGVQYIVPSFVAASLAIWTALRQHIFVWAVLSFGLFSCVWAAIWAIVERAMHGLVRTQAPFVGVTLALLGMMAAGLRFWVIKKSKQLIDGDKKAYEAVWERLKGARLEDLHELMHVCDQVHEASVGQRARQYMAVVHGHKTRQECSRAGSMFGDSFNAARLLATPYKSSSSGEDHVPVSVKCVTDRLGTAAQASANEQYKGQSSPSNTCSSSRTNSFSFHGVGRAGAIAAAMEMQHTVLGLHACVEGGGTKRGLTGDVNMRSWDHQASEKPQPTNPFFKKSWSVRGSSGMDLGSGTSWRSRETQRCSNSAAGEKASSSEDDNLSSMARHGGGGGSPRHGGGGSPRSVVTPRSVTQSGKARLLSFSSKRRRKMRDAYWDVDFSRPISSLDQLYSQAAGIDPILRLRVQDWALGSDGYFPSKRVRRCSEREEEDGCDSGKSVEFVRWADVADYPQMCRRIKWSRIKSVDRAIEKTLRSYGEDASRIVDLARQCIVFQDVRSLTRCLKLVLEDHEIVVVRVKNRLHVEYDSNISAGYRDVALNIRIVNAHTIRLGLCSHVCEVQLLLRDFAELRNDAGHKRYIRFRNFKGE